MPRTPKSRKHPVAADYSKNPELREELSSLRGLMVGAAEKHKLPQRFEVTPDEGLPAMWIKDLETGRQARVSMYAYGAVREVLRDLFGEK